MPEKGAPRPGARDHRVGEGAEREDEGVQVGEPCRDTTLDNLPFEPGVAESEPVPQLDVVFESDDIYTWSTEGDSGPDET